MDSLALATIFFMREGIPMVNVPDAQVFACPLPAARDLLAELKWRQRGTPHHELKNSEIAIFVQIGVNTDHVRAQETSYGGAISPTWSVSTTAPAGYMTMFGELHILV